MTMQQNRPTPNGLAQPRRSVQSARKPPPPLPEAARRQRRDVQPPPPQNAVMEAPMEAMDPTMMYRPAQLPMPQPQFQPPPQPQPMMMMPVQRPMPVTVRRDDLEATIVKAIAMPASMPQREEPPQEDPLSPATEARSARAEKTAKIRMRGSFAFSRDAVERAMRRLVSDYRELSKAKRLLIPVAIILLLAGAPSSSRAGEAAKHTAAPAVTAAVVTAAPKPVAPPAPSATPALPPGGVLPSARALAPSSQTALSPEERRQYDRAISATLGGDFDSAQAICTRLAAAHPESSELSAAARVLSAKMKRKATK